MFVTHAQAIAAYLSTGARLPVALSPAAVAYHAKHATLSAAGLAELSAVSDPYHRRGMFETNAAFNARDLQLRSDTRAMHVA
jgi:hypothetical protein